MHEERLAKLESDMTKLEGDMLQLKMQYALFVPQLESIQNVLRGDLGKGLDNPGVLQTLVRMMRDLYGAQGDSGDSIVSRLRECERFQIKWMAIMGTTMFFATAAGNLLMWLVEHKVLKP